MSKKAKPDVVVKRLSIDPEESIEEITETFTDLHIGGDYGEYLEALTNIFRFKDLMASRVTKVSLEMEIRACARVLQSDWVCVGIVEDDGEMTWSISHIKSIPKKFLAVLSDE